MLGEFAIGALPGPRRGIKVLRHLIHPSIGGPKRSASVSWLPCENHAFMDPVVPYGELVGPRNAR